jgi:hypothetical protein
MFTKKFCKEHIGILERLTKVETKLEILILLNIATIGIILLLKYA